MAIKTERNEKEKITLLHSQGPATSDAKVLRRRWGGEVGGGGGETKHHSREGEEERGIPPPSPPCSTPPPPIHPPLKPPDFLSRSNPLLDMLPLCSSTLTRRLVPPALRRRPPVCSGIMEPMSGMINPPEDAGGKHRSVSGGRGE